MKNELVVVGAWGLFDHFMALEKFPLDGETVCTEPTAVSAEKAFFGDCSGNIAAVAAGMGAKSSLVSVAGGDFITSGYKAHLEKLGVNLQGMTILPEESSGHNYNCFASDGQGFCISQQGAAAFQSESMIQEEWFANAEYTVLCEAFSSYTLEALRCARRQGSKIVISGMVGDRNPLWKEFLEGADILFINQSEFSRLTELAGTEEHLLDAFGLEQIFVTCGSKGSRSIHRDGTTLNPIIRTEKVVDPTGAGDAFVAGTLTAMLAGKSVRSAPIYGAAASSYIIEAFGCQTNLPSWEQIVSRIESQFE